MHSIDELTREYSDRLRLTEKVTECLKIMSEMSQSEFKTADVKSLSIAVNDFVVDYPDVIPNSNAIQCILKLYIECFENILILEKALQELPTDVKDISGIIGAKEDVIASKEKYDKELLLLSEARNINIDCFEDFIDELNNIFDSIETANVESKDKIVEEAKIWRKESEPLRVRYNDTISDIDRLPETYLIARSKNNGNSEKNPLFRTIGYSTDSKTYCLEYRKNGNFLISLDRDSIRDLSIDLFILSYIFRTLDSFPAGCINIHLFDKNPNYLYMRLLNEIRSEVSDENTKRFFKIHDKLSEIVSIKKVIEGDIFHKTSPEIPDLYSLYETDKSDQFNLIILREGLVDATGHIPPELIETIENMTDPNNQGHRCGMRFLIVDASRSLERLSPNVQSCLEKIKNNCELIVDFDKEKFTINGDEVKLLEIEDEIDSFVCKKTQVIASIVNARKKSFISIDETVTDIRCEYEGGILSIPIGKSGDEIISLPFTCNNGACIGYMVIGQTGTGKSSFFHSLVLNGCLKYTPKELQFWLLDFKNGDASSKYRESGIPHIGKLSENNKIDDAICLFDMILEEMERRAVLLRDSSNVAEYNKTARERGKEYLPRIIIIVDEAQELFREENAQEVQKRISQIATRMRYAGMHFVMIAQNLNEKAYMLEDAFLKHANGRVCLRVSQEVPREAGFGEDFVTRGKEISELADGEAYIRDGITGIKKVKIAYASPEEMKTRLFEKIREQYTEYSNMRPLIIGSKEKLAVTDMIPRENKMYHEGLKGLIEKNGIYAAIIGEDVYRMHALELKFSQGNNSSVLFIGSDREIASSLCSSIVLSLARQKVKMHLFNGDKQMIVNETGKYQHPFKHICQYFKERNDGVQYHPTNEFAACVRDFYETYLERDEMMQNAEEDDVDFSPVFIVINDLFGIKSYANNDILEDYESESCKNHYVKNDLDDLLELSKNPKRNKKTFTEEIQSIINKIIKNGYRYNIHIIVSVMNPSDSWRGARVIPEIKNLIMYNKTDCQDRLDHSHILKDMLDSISNRYGDESMAVYVTGQKFSKIRPIIYRMDDKELIDSLLKGCQV